MGSGSFCHVSNSSFCDSAGHRQVRQFKTRWQMRWAALDDAISSEHKWHEELRKTLDHVLCQAMPEETLYRAPNNGEPDWMQNWICTVLVRAFLCAVWPDPKCVKALDHQFLALDGYHGFQKQRALRRNPDGATAVCKKHQRKPRPWKTWPLSDDLPIAEGQDAWSELDMASSQGSFDGDSAPFPSMERGYVAVVPSRSSKTIDITDLDQVETSAGQLGISYPTSTNSMSRSPLDLHQQKLVPHCIMVSLCCAGRPRPPPRSLKQLLNIIEAIPLSHTLFGDYTSPLPAYSIGSKVYDVYSIDAVVQVTTNFVTYKATAFLLSCLPQVILTAFRHPQDYTRATFDGAPAQRKPIIKLMKRRQRTATYFDTFVCDGLIWVVQRQIDSKQSSKKAVLAHT